LVVCSVYVFQQLLPLDIQQDLQTQQRVVHPAEFQAGKCSTRFKDTVRLFQDVRD
jgi:hypothetical protein